MDNFEQRFNISQNKVNDAPPQFLPQIETSFHFQDTCPYRLLIGTSPTLLRKLSKGLAPSNNLKKMGSQQCGAMGVCLINFRPRWCPLYRLKPWGATSGCLHVRRVVVFKTTRRCAERAAARAKSPQIKPMRRHGRVPHWTRLSPTG